MDHILSYSLVSDNLRIRKAFSVGHNSIVDDFCYFSADFQLGNFSHVGANCTILGGNGKVFIGDFVNIAPGTRIVSASHDYTYGGLCGPTIPEEFKGLSVTEDVHISDHVLIGCNTVILPGVEMPEGMAVGALSLVPKGLYKPWTLYAGIPIKAIGPRDKTKILEQAEKLAYTG